MSLTNEQAKVIAQKLDQGHDEFFAASREDKVKILRNYLDEQIGDEPKAEIKKVEIPGIGFEVSGAVLERATDMVLDAVATLIVKKFFSKEE